MTSWHGTWGSTCRGSKWSELHKPLRDRPGRLPGRPAGLQGLVEALVRDARAQGLLLRERQGREFELVACAI
eukprot:9562999-Lingulodinium_polyedra.AAC.1